MKRGWPHGLRSYADWAGDNWTFALYAATVKNLELYLVLYEAYIDRHSLKFVSSNTAKCKTNVFCKKVDSTIICAKSFGNFLNESPYWHLDVWWDKRCQNVKNIAYKNGLINANATLHLAKYTFNYITVVENGRRMDIFARNVIRLV